MVQIEAQRTGAANARVWIFRVLLVAGAAFMIYSWFAPWWTAKLSVIPGEDHMVLRPWGIEAVAQVRNNSDESLYSMPWFFAPFMWTYLTLCMLALAASLFVQRQISLGPINLSLATFLIGLVGVSYMAAVGIAYGVGELKAGWADTNFIGTSTIKTMTGAKVKMVSELQIGYWLAVGAGGVLFVLALLRRFIVGRSSV